MCLVNIGDTNVSKLLPQNEETDDSLRYKSIFQIEDTKGSYKSQEQLFASIVSPKILEELLDTIANTVSVSCKCIS